MVGLIIPVSSTICCAEPPVAYDLEMAKKICDELPLETIEGVWLYPDDKVTVLILNDGTNNSSNLMPSYTISVVDTDDARLHPGDHIGTLNATAEDRVYKIELVTERHNDLLLKPKSCIATLSKEGDSFLIKKQKSPIRGRLNLNFNRLLPGFWKIVSTGISTTGTGSTVKVPVGMIKVYPSYDGNGSSRRKVRYL